ncbi:MAG: transposase [Chloroflexi bacterium]|nr:transposase [Chloroflexota bacterium]
MSNYRRAYCEGGTYFFTAVTYGRRPIFREEQAIVLLTKCFQSVKKLHPFEVNAFVTLPDHLHCIWTLPDGDNDFSTRWKKIKACFTSQWVVGTTLPVSESKQQKGEKGVWQRRFWEHMIRDQEDFNRHCDYIHYNPVKHGLVKSAAEWKYSSFRRFVEQGIYKPDWGGEVDDKVVAMEFE